MPTVARGLFYMHAMMFAESILKKMSLALQELLYEIYSSNYEGFADIKLSMETKKKSKKETEQEFTFSVIKHEGVEEKDLPKLDRENCRRYHFKPSVGIKSIK